MVKLNVLLWWHIKRKAERSCFFFSFFKNKWWQAEFSPPGLFVLLLMLSWVEGLSFVPFRVYILVFLVFGVDHLLDTHLCWLGAESFCSLLPLSLCGSLHIYGSSTDSCAVQSSAEQMFRQFRNFIYHVTSALHHSCVANLKFFSNKIKSTWVVTLLLCSSWSLTYLQIKNNPDFHFKAFKSGDDSNEFDSKKTKYEAETMRSAAVPWRLNLSVKVMSTTEIFPLIKN